MVNLKSHFQKNNLAFKISIILSTIIFFTSSLFGYFINLSFDKAKIYPNFIDIVINNSVLCFILILGVITLGLSSFILLILNGIYLGSALQYSINSVGLVSTLKLFIPHAIFEIPAIILSASIGFLLITCIVLKGHFKIKINFKYFLKYFSICILIIAILIILAAFIESTISMPI